MHYFLVTPTVFIFCLVMSNTLYRAISPKIKNLLTLFSQWMSNKDMWAQGTSRDTNPKELWVMFQSRFQALARSFQTPPSLGSCVTSNLLLSLPIGEEIQSNAPGMPGPTTLGLNIDWCIKLTWRQFTQFPNPNNQTWAPFHIWQNTPAALDRYLGIGEPQRAVGVFSL